MAGAHPKVIIPDPHQPGIGEGYKDCGRCAQKGMPADYDGLYCLACEDEIAEILFENETLAAREAGSLH